MLLAWLPAAARAAPPAEPSVQHVRYPRAEENADQRDAYPVQLLTLALEKSGHPYVLEPSQLFMLQARSISELQQGRDLDVIWTMTSADRERTLLPVRIPIDRGLLGWRLLLVRENDRSSMAGVHSLAALAELRAGQGADWPDTSILRANGLVVDESAHYSDLFRKLTALRIDYFPRSVQEIWGELATHHEGDFVVEPHLALHYPTAMYFFVNKSETALAADIERGLRKALQDGSFEALFQRHFGAVLEKSGLAQREVLELHNPLLPPQTPLGDARLWYRPSAEVR